MKIVFAADHAGFELKKTLLEHVRGLGHESEDLGAFSFEEGDDYPDLIARAAVAVHEDSSLRAVVIGGSGHGEAMVANRFSGVRAAVFYGGVHAHGAVDIEGKEGEDPYEIVRLSRLHNDANVLSLGARFVTPHEAQEALSIWLATPFSQEKRHERRIEKIDAVSKHILL